MTRDARGDALYFSRASIPSPQRVAFGEIPLWGDGRVPGRNRAAAGRTVNAGQALLWRAARRARNQNSWHAYVLPPVVMSFPGGADSTRAARLSVRPIDMTDPAPHWATYRSAASAMTISRAWPA